MGGLVLHRGSLETLARMRSGGQEGEFKVQAYTQVRREITTLLRGVIDMHVGRRLRSVDFVRKANP